MADPKPPMTAEQMAINIADVTGIPADVQEPVRCLALQLLRAYGAQKRREGIEEAAQAIDHWPVAAARIRALLDVEG